MVQHRVQAVQQHLDIEQFQRQIQLGGQLPAALEKLLAPRRNSISVRSSSAEGRRSS